MLCESAAKTLLHFAENAARVLNNPDSPHHDRWESIVDEINSELPSGSGFDAGSQFDVDASKPGRLVFNTAYHHMNDGGYYDGWTEHEIIVTPSFLHGFDMRIMGRNRNDIKDYIGEVFAETFRNLYVMEIDGIRPAIFNAKWIDASEARRLSFLANLK